ncbi:MAG TPA: hypothetical protein VEW95_05485 [Candidatus Limnocylindrales bacterium]|nr:hypothetical protein [Candidatus Limnocylindrales bacterium]
MSKRMRLVLIGDRQGIIESDQPLSQPMALQLREQLDAAFASGSSMVLSDQFEVIDRRPTLNVARLIEALGNVTGQRWDGEGVAAEYERLRVEAAT